MTSAAPGWARTALTARASRRLYPASARPASRSGTLGQLGEALGQPLQPLNRHVRGQPLEVDDERRLQVGVAAPQADGLAVELVDRRQRRVVAVAPLELPAAVAGDVVEAADGVDGGRQAATPRERRTGRARPGCRPGSRHRPGGRAAGQATPGRQATPERQARQQATPNRPAPPEPV